MKKKAEVGKEALTQQRSTLVGERKKKKTGIKTLRAYYTTHQGTVTFACSSFLLQNWHRHRDTFLCVSPCTWCHSESEVFASDISRLKNNNSGVHAGALMPSLMCLSCNRNK